MRVVVIGAGHNGLAAAFYLAKAGLRPLVLEQSDTVGGGAITSELHPGFRCPTFADEVSLRSDIAEDMELQRRGVEFLRAPVETFAPVHDGPPLVVYADAARTAVSLKSASQKDASRYVAYRASLTGVARVLDPLLSSPPPDIDRTGAPDLWSLLTTARRFRSLARHDAYALLRWAPMPIADFAEEWFETPGLQALASAPGLTGTMFGPRSAGSTLVMLLREAARSLAGNRSRVRGGPGVLTTAMASAALDAGAEFRASVPVRRILIHDGRVTGVGTDHEEIVADVVVSAIDPKATFLGLVDPVHLSPDFLVKIRGYRAAGTVAKVNLALTGLPRFVGVNSRQSGGNAPSELLSGRIHIGPHMDYLERAFDDAKYGAPSAEPWLAVTIPSVADPTLTPPGAHVMSIYVHYAPHELRERTWADLKDSLLRKVLSVLERFAPGIQQLIAASEVLTPADLEQRLKLSGGHIFHGELALDQLSIMRPVIGYARYQSPVTGLFLCSAGTHPGGFMSGGSGRLAAREVIRWKP